MDHEASVTAAEAIRSRSCFLLAAITAVSAGNVLVRYWEHWMSAGILLVIASGVLAYAARWAPTGPAPPWVWFLAVIACTACLDRAPLPAPIVAVVIVLGSATLVLGPRHYPIALAGVAAAIGTSTLKPMSVGSARIDVFTMIQGATGAFVRGTDPYQPTFAVDNVGGGYPATFPSHFGYGPAVILLAAPGRLLGDVRFAAAAMVAIIVLCIGLLAARQGRERDIRPFLVLLTVCPLAPSMIFYAWAEPYGLACLAGWVVLRGRHPRLAVVALGVCLATKPTLAAVVLYAALWSRSVRRDLLPAGGVAAMLFLPFALWDGPRASLAAAAAALGQGGTPVFVNRVDAVTINTLLHGVAGLWLPAAALLALQGIITIPIVMTRPRDRADIFALGGALTIAILVSSRIAFLNYYYVATIALFIALAFEAAPATPGDVRIPGLLAGLVNRLPRRAIVVDGV